MEARLLSILSVIFAFAYGHAADSDVLERLAVAPGGWIYGYDEINYDIDEANRRMELNNYYPYGMPMSSTASVQPYKYGGKELDRANGLDMSCRYAYLLRRMRKFVSALDLYYLYHTVNQNRG